MKKLIVLFLLIPSTYIIGQKNYQITSIDGTKLYIQEFGSVEPVILLAGGPGLNAIYLKPIWDSLSSKHRCIVLDQRGTGKSKTAKIDTVSFTIENYVNDLEALRKYLKLDQITLIGHSWGGMLSMEYASKHPNEVKQLILLGPGGPTVKFFDYFPDNMMMRLHQEDLQEMNLLDSLKKSSLKAVWPGYFFDRDRALETKSITNFDVFDFPPEVYRYSMSSYFSSDNKRIRLIKKFKGPVHIIQGRQDPIGESTIFEIKNLLPQSQVHLIEKCGHLPWLENAEQIKIFFAQLRGSLK